MKLKEIFQNIDLKLFYLFLFLLPFQVSLFLGNLNKSWSFYNDLTGFWLYLSDILLVLILIFGWQKLLNKRGNWIPASRRRHSLWRRTAAGMTAGKALISFFLWAAISIFWSLHYQISIYRSIKLLLLIFLFFYIQKAITADKELRNKSYLAIFSAGVIQSIIGIWQFIAQKSVGFRLIGEPVFTSATAGIAKIEYDGEKIVRAYGTFPHPNILGGFLFLALICGILVFIKSPLIPLFQRGKEERQSDSIGSPAPSIILAPLSVIPAKTGISTIKTKHWIPIFTGMTAIIICLILTFSRSAWIAGGFILIVPVGSIVLPRLWNYLAKRLHSSKETMDPTKKEKRQSVIPAKAGISNIKTKHWIPVFTGITTIILILIFTFPLIKNRFTAYQEAIETRKLPTAAAMEIFRQTPCLGIGLGNFLPKSLKLTAGQAIEQWEIQPVHNIYLLVLAELGFIGLLFFLNFLFKLLKQAFKKVKNSPELFLLTLLFFGFLIIGLFDHYFLTLQQGMLMFWISAGLLS